MQCILNDITNIQWILQEVFVMSFKIRADRKESENKTIRFPLQLIEKIEAAIEGKGVTFSSFVIQACKYALDNLDEQENGRN